MTAAEVAPLIRRARELGWSDEKIAATIDCSVATVRLWRLGDRPGMKVQRRLLDGVEKLRASVARRAK